MEKVNEIVGLIDTFVWGPVMLVLLVGTGIFLTIRLRFLPWRNLGYALHSVLSKEARPQTRHRRRISILRANDRACCHYWNRQHHWRSHGNVCRRPWSPGVDVDLSMFRPNFQIQRMHAGYQIPRD